MKMTVSCILIIIFAALTGCNTDNVELVESIKDERIVQANTTFAFDLFRKINHEDVQENIFISPLSVSAALTMNYNGAENSTKEAMEDTLGFSELTKEEVNSGFKYMKKYLEKIDKKIELEMSNSIWIRKGEEINQDFIDLNIDVFNAYTKSLDFSKKSAVDKINQWIDTSTHGLIKKVLNAPISEDVIMYLINAIYFKGEWTQKFDKGRTYDAIFYNGLGEQNPIEMMSMKESVDFMESNNYKAVKLYYGNKKTAMVCILPNEDVDINDFIESLDGNKWAEIQEEFHESDIIVKIPKFKMEYGVKKLNDTLKSLGMAEAFEYEADFGGIREDLYISEVLHKAVIEVNEEGSEAATVTVVTDNTSSVMEPTSFIADRPFIFIITDEEMGSILFMGKAYDL